MGRGKLTSEEQEILRRNPNVAKVTGSSIVYTNAFKKHFVEEYAQGKKPKEIFVNAGFDADVLGSKRIERASARWREAYAAGTLNKFDEESIKRHFTDEKKEQLDELAAAKRKLARQEEKIRKQEAEIEALKKAGRIGRRRCEKKEFGRIDLCEIVRETVEKFGNCVNIRELCKALELPRSSYYYYISAEENRQKKEEEEMEALFFIQKAYDHSGRFSNKGSGTIRMILKNKHDINYSRKKIQRIMRKYGLVCPVKTVNPYKKMWKATKEDKIAPNLVKREFKTGEARKLFLTDITYIKHRGHFSYVSVILDAQTNEPVAHETSTSLKMDFVMESLEQLKACGYSKNAVIHSDQGVHYTSKIFREEIAAMGLTQTMSRKGNCWDNAPCESFFGRMKQEAHFNENATDKEIEEAVTEYIMYYRYDRYQEGLGEMTPYEYGSKMLSA